MSSKVKDGLEAYRAMEVDRGIRLPYALVDERLKAMGYTDAQVESILDVLVRLEYIDWGVSVRTGWLTPSGRAALERLA